jgi:hypothetical protein
MDAAIETAAERHGLSPSAADALYRALVAGGGHQAQFNHPELGGMGQWSGGMTQIGAMFDDALKAKVSGFCQDVAPMIGRDTARPRVSEDAGRETSSGWWPPALGMPASAGSQNGLRYACFPERRRLAIEHEGRMTLYDTGDRRLTGFAQQQGSGNTLLFSGPDGSITLEDLRVVPA